MSPHEEIPSIDGTPQDWHNIEVASFCAISCHSLRRRVAFDAMHIHTVRQPVQRWKYKGARFENLVASQLLKYCHWIEDTQGYAMELRYLRDVVQREVDFVVLRDRRPLFAVECKAGEKSLGSAIQYFAERT